MNLIEEHNKRWNFFRDITGEAMKVHRKYHKGLIDAQHRYQLWNYMNLTHIPYGMLINFGADSLFSEWYYRNPDDGNIEKIKLL